MKPKTEIEQKIIKITTKIHEEFPELSKFIQEMPENNSENDEVTVKSLENYYESLKAMLKKYAKTHQ